MIVEQNKYCWCTDCRTEWILHARIVQCFYKKKTEYYHVCTCGHLETVTGRFHFWWHYWFGNKKLPLLILSHTYTLNTTHPHYTTLCFKGTPTICTHEHLHTPHRAPTVWTHEHLQCDHLPFRPLYYATSNIAPFSKAAHIVAHCSPHEVGRISSVVVLHHLLVNVRNVQGFRASNVESN